MYDIRQFLPMVWLLVWTGITAYALAAEAPTLWIISTAAILLNRWLRRSGRFKPVPRWIAAAITLLAAIYTVMAFYDSTANGSISGPSILLVGQFLVVLQLVKLFEQRGNRDYAQILVLSLLLVVAASISTSRLEAGLLVIGYMFLALYASLLFHLKVEADHAKAAIGISEDHINPMTLRQDQRYLGRSMRRLTSLISVVALALAVFVFLFFPRNFGAGLFGQLQQRPSQALTGFSDSVNFQQVAQISQSSQIVAYVQWWDDDKQVEGLRPLLLRGATLDLYSGNAPGNVRWQWQRTTSPPEIVNDDLADQRPVEIQHDLQSDSQRQDVRLEPTGSEQLFAIAGLTRIRPLDDLPFGARLRFQERDQTVRIEPTPSKTFHYEATSTGELRAIPSALPHPRTWTAPAGNQLHLTQSAIDPKIEEYARRPDVSGSDERGSLAARRDRTKLVTEIDELIAANIAQHLMSNQFSYTLDLSDARNIGNRDPVEAFLYTLKRGHCEYFAGSMVLMCQSLGLQARLVIGFKCDEYNAMTQSYVVRQSHAHAWVEVLNDDYRWVTFDPTSGRDMGEIARRDSPWTKMKQFIDYLEYTWANSVVAYDRDTRSSVIQNVETSLNSSADNGMESLKRAKQWFDLDALSNSFSRSALLAQWSAKLVVGLIALLVLVLLIAIIWFVMERWKLRRRAKRIGLQAMSHDERLKMAKQLGFYDDLLRLLARHKIIPPANLTPMEFSQSLLFLPNELFDTIRRVTEIYYRVRYGSMQITGLQQRKLKTTVNRIESALGAKVEATMKQAIILSIGDELVLGQTVDTNSAWLSRKLAEVGIGVLAHQTVADDQRAIENAIRSAIGRCDFLIVSGGLGPTADDLTRQALAVVMDAPLELNEQWLAHMQAYFKERGRVMPETNKIQAMIPRGAKMIWNTNGTAAGIEAEIRRTVPPSGISETASDLYYRLEELGFIGRTRIFVMPGVPKEMFAMFDRDLLPALQADSGGSVILSRTLHTFGLGESAIAEKLGDLMKRDRNPSVGTTVSGGIVSLRVNARFDSRDEASMQLETTSQLCRDALGELIFGQDDDTLQSVVAKMLLDAKKTVATAESCTGGLLAKMLTDISGSSAYFQTGFITYSNKAKYERLGVSMEILDIYGAVSEPVAVAMAKNARRLAHADFALSITGIAGPTGGSPTKPVGTVCIALAFDDNTPPVVRTFNFPGDREWVRDRSAKMALSMLRYKLLERSLPL